MQNLEIFKGQITTVKEIAWLNSKPTKEMKEEWRSAFLLMVETEGISQEAALRNKLQIKQLMPYLQKGNSRWS